MLAQVPATNISYVFRDIIIVIISRMMLCMFNFYFFFFSCDLIF